jgi:hypothetical protein
MQSVGWNAAEYSKQHAASYDGPPVRLWNNNQTFNGTST